MVIPGPFLPRRLWLLHLLGVGAGRLSPFLHILSVTVSPRDPSLLLTQKTLFQCLPSRKPGVQASILFSTPGLPPGNGPELELGALWGQDLLTETSGAEGTDLAQSQPL